MRGSGRIGWGRDVVEEGVDEVGEMVRGEVWSIVGGEV